MESSERPACKPLLPSGEIRGSMLVGLIRAFRNIQLISGDVAADMADGIESNAWYPMASFFRLLDAVCQRDIDYDPILFQAGIAVAEDWYENGAGRSIVSGAVDFLRLQGDSGGYSTVHRGAAADIGWMDLVELDEAAGRAVLVCVTPYPKEFERGVLFGGTSMCGDVQYVHVESFEEPYNDHLSRKTLTIGFVLKPDAATGEKLDAFLAEMSPERPTAVPASLAAAMAWRLKNAEELRRIEGLFHQQSGLLLARASEEICALSRRLDDLAHHDELTGLLNRRAILKRAEGLLALGTRHERPVSFVMIDVDHFKAINDLWGHAAGDDALRLVGSLLQDRLRDSDLLGRIGGEEFLVVLPDTDIDGARIVAENLRMAVAEQMHLAADGQRIPVTISLGVSTAMSRLDADIGTQLRQADQALYRSKRDGRNRVTCSTH